MATTDKFPSRKETQPVSALPTVSLDELAVRQIIADIDGITTGRRRVDIMRAILTIVGQEIAANAASPAAAKHHGQITAKQLKAFVRDAYGRRRTPGATT